MKLVHNNNNNIIINNNNKKKFIYKNKNLFKKFIQFIIKLIITINEEIEIRNYIGDQLERRKAIYNLTNDVPDKKLIKKLEIIKDGPEDADDKFVDEMAEEEPKLFSGEWGSDIDKKVAEFRRRERIKKTKKENKEKKEKEEYGKIYNFLSEFDKTPKKEKNEYENIKIKRNIIKTIKDQKKEKIEKVIKDKIEEDLINNKRKEKGKKDEDSISLSDLEEIEIGEMEQPIVAYEADFLYPKISARELFIKNFPDEKFQHYAINYINKNYKDDAPTDDEIHKMGDLIYSHYTRTLSGNGFYAMKWNELRNKILEYYANGGKSFRCEYCKEYVSCKRRHCLHCEKFLNKLDNDPKQLILKKYIENNYKKLKIQEIDLILNRFKGKNSNFIKEYLPGYIKKGRNVRIKWIDKHNKKREIAEKLGVEISQLPPIHFNTGLAKKLLAEITNFDNKKK